MQQTESGYYVIQPGDLDIKSGRREGQVRSTCPVCRDQRTHGTQACMSINLSTGFGQCFKCGAKFVLQEQYERYLSNIQYDKPLKTDEIMKSKDLDMSHGATLKKEGSRASEPSSVTKRDSGGRLDFEPSLTATQRKSYRLPDVTGLDDTLNGTLVDYLLRRDIDPKVALRAGVRGARRTFGGLERDCLAFCYNEAGAR